MMPQPSFYNHFSVDHPVRQHLAQVRSHIVQIQALESRIFSEFSGVDIDTLAVMLECIREHAHELQDTTLYAVRFVQDRIDERHHEEEQLRDYKRSIEKQDDSESE